MDLFSGANRSTALAVGALSCDSVSYQDTCMGMTHEVVGGGGRGDAEEEEEEEEEGGGRREVCFVLTGFGDASDVAP